MILAICSRGQASTGMYASRGGAVRASCHRAQSDGDRSSLRSLLEASKGLRAAGLERVYGLDYIVPGYEGIARMVVWWSPQRREVMAELRAF